MVGDIGELEVPDSLHALLAARLDALDPQVRHVLTDAAVLGSSFPFEAVVAVSGLDTEVLTAIMSELLRREVLEISADPLSPERGSYRFSQEMLRQVAYDTLSRRDRKARHLAVAAHLRNTFPNDGEEVVDVIARHYIDALEAVPDEPDSVEIRESAIATLVRAAERAQRSGSQARAATCFVDAADLIHRAADDDPRQPALLKRGADAAMRSGRADEAVPRLERAIGLWRGMGDSRSAASAASMLGRGLRQLGRFTEARGYLTEAVEELRPDPDLDTVDALEHLASFQMFEGNVDADPLSSEALALAQALDVAPDRLGRVFLTRGIVLDYLGSHREAAMYIREAAELSEHVDSGGAVMAYLNLGNVLNVNDPAAAMVASQRAVDLALQSGELYGYTTGVYNLFMAMLALGEWRDADEALARAMHDGAEIEAHYLTCAAAWLHALRGDAEAGQRELIALDHFRDTEDPQDLAMISSVRAFLAHAAGHPAEALEHARRSLGHVAQALPFDGDDGRWVWPLAARCAHELGDLDTERELLDLVESRPTGHIAAVQRAEAQLIRARLAAADGDPAGADFTSAIEALRSHGTPFHLAQGLLDHAEMMSALGDVVGADAAIDDARAIATTLGAGHVLAAPTAWPATRPRRRRRPPTRSG